MKQIVNIGVIGDFDPQKTTHPAIDNAIRDAAKHLSIEANITWLPTPSFLTETGQKNLSNFDCVWASSGSPYESTDGAIKGIQIARELNKPFIGT